MSTQHLAILAAVTTHSMMKNSSDEHRYGGGHQHTFDQQMPPRLSPNGNEFRGNVNILLGGAMLSVVLTMVCFVCYCCHRNLRKRSESVYRQRWLEAEANMEIYSVAQCYDLSPEPRHAAIPDAHQPASLSPSLTNSGHGPPPSYETVVAMDRTRNGCDKCLRALQRSQCSYTNYGQSHDHDMPMVHATTAKYDAVELNNNTDVPTTSTAATATAAAQILNVRGMVDAAAGSARAASECDCDGCRTASASTPTTTTSTSAALPDDHYEYIRKCRRCGSEINDRDYCDCFTMTTLPNNATNVNNQPQPSTASTSSSTSSTPMSPSSPVRTTDDNHAAAAGTVAAATDNNANITSAHLHAASADEDNGTAIGQSCATPHCCANNNPTDDEMTGELAPSGSDCAAAANCTATAQPSPQCSGCNQQYQRQQNCGDAGECRECDGNGNGNGHRNSTVNLDAFNGGGLIRMDMSQIIDHTGLPTYEAALKFESSGYV